LHAAIDDDREYFKKRHWEQAHKDENINKYAEMIVRKDHEKARNFLRQMKETKGKDLPQNTSQISLIVHFSISAHLTMSCIKMSKYYFDAPPLDQSFMHDSESWQHQYNW
jgi:hypothetical protein